MEVIEVKVRAVGTSLGVLLPKDAVDKEHIKLNQTIQIAILKKDLKLLDEVFGIAKGTKPFKRDHKDRVF